MPMWMRRVLGLVAGVFVAGGSIALVEMVGHQILQGGGLFVLAAIGLGVGAFLGGTLANWIAKDNRISWGVGLLLAALSLVNVFTFPHPVWFVPTGFTLIVIGVLAANRLSNRRAGGIS